MAECMRFVCNACGHAIEAWDDGNPYYLDKRGRKHYAYHPDSKRSRCIGIDSPHICLSCGEKFDIDSENPVTTCISCNSTDITKTFTLGKRRCPYCKQGVLVKDRNFYCVS